MKINSEIDYLIGENERNIDIEKYIGFMKLKQSFESLFFLCFVFCISLMIFNVKEVDKIIFTETIKETNEESQREIYRFNENITMNFLRGVYTTEEVEVERGQNLYKIFKEYGIEYNEKNIRKVEILNPNLKNIKNLSIGDKIVIPLDLNQTE